jgi:Tol biopolymer transport system component
VLALFTSIAINAAEKNDAAKVALEAAKKKEVVDGDLKAAIEQYKAIVSKYKTDRATAAEALIRMAECYGKLGDAEAQKAYERVTKEYGDQKEAVALAQAHLPNSRELDTEPTVTNLGRISPDGRYISYAAKGGTDLMVRDIATGTDRVIKHFDSGHVLYTMVSSPDGKRIAFNFDNGSWVDIRSISLDGTGLRTLLEDKDRGWAVVNDWSPDGTRLLISKGQADSGLFWLDLADGRLQMIAQRKGSGGLGWPRLSPDGRYIVVRSAQGGLDLIAGDGTGEILLTGNRNDLNAAGWTPDSRRVLFIRRQRDNVELWAMPISNGKADGDAVLVDRQVYGIKTEAMQVVGNKLLFVKPSTRGQSEVDSVELTGPYK